MSKQLYPCLWFDNQARAAADFYCSIFPNSRILIDTGLVVNFELNGQLFMGLNTNPHVAFTESISFVIPCKDQQEIDHYWNKLTADGGKESMCGWCSDKFGISWQVVPEILGALMSDPKKRDRVIQAFMKMKKFDIAALMNA